MAQAVQLDGPGDLTDDQREALSALLYRLADDELVLAERYTEWAVHAPTLESDLSIANIAQDELGHGRLWYDLLMDFGEDERSLIFERDPATFRHATLCELPFADGDWADTVVRSYLYDVAEEIRLDALTGTSYYPLADRVGKVLKEERYHREHAQNWLERLTAGEDGMERTQAALDRLFPYALTLFEPSEHEDEIVEFGFQTRSLDDMREEWLDVTIPYLESLGLDVPMDPEDDAADLLPDRIGRDGDHTDHWAQLHDEMTNTYRELGRPEPEKIMDRDD